MVGAKDDKIIIFNDIDLNIKELITATNEYGIMPIKWSEKEQYLDFLAA